jgi:nucleoid-associated protein
MNINFAVIHSLEKNKNEYIVQKKVLKESVLDVKNAAVKNLVESMVEIIGKTDNNVSYGQFREDGKAGLFPGFFDSYLSDLPHEDGKFIALTHNSFNEVVKRALEAPLSTGGYLLFAQYTKLDSDYLIVGMIKHKGAIRLNSQLEPEGIQQLDLSKIYHAVRINISLYKKQKKIPVAGEGKDSCYMGFIGRNSDGKASEYFVEAFGCIKGPASARVTNNAVTAVVSFFKSKPELAPMKALVNDKIIEYFFAQLALGQMATLDGIRHEASKLLAPLQECFLDGLVEFLNHEDRGIPDEFYVNVGAIKKRTKLKSGDKKWSIQFDRNIFGNTEECMFYFNEKSKKLVVSSLPPEFLKEMQQEIFLRDVDIVTLGDELLKEMS